MNTSKFLSGNKIYFRPYQDKDAELVYDGKNNQTVREALFLFAPVTMDQVKAELQTWSTSKEINLFTICELDSNTSVGQTAFVRIDYVSRAAVFYIAIYDDSYWSKGYGGEATQLMLYHAFETLNLNRIHLHVCTENKKAVKAYQKAGYTIEGTLRQAMYLRNKYYDFYVMSILRNEYYAMMEK